MFRISFFNFKLVTMNLPTYLIIVLIFLYALWLFQRKRDKRKYYPGPIRLPIIGSLIQMAIANSGKNSHLEVFGDFCKKYGPVCGWYAGIHYFLIIEDPEIAKKVMNSEDFAGRYPSTSVAYNYYFKKNLGLIFSYGEKWREIRKYTMRSLKNFGFGRVKSVEAFLAEEMTDFIQSFDKLREENNDIVQIHSLFNLSALNIIWCAVAGERFSHNNRTLKRLIRLVDEGSQAESPAASPLYVYPAFRFIPGLTGYQRVLTLFQNLQNFFAEVLEQRRSQGTYKSNPKDFTDNFIREIEINDNSLFNDQQFQCVMVDLFIAGVDTTAVTLEWAILFMITNERVYNNVLKEILDIIGPTRRPSLSDRMNMTYTEATIWEILRLGNVLPLSGRAPLKDAELDGHFVPKNTFIIINILNLHHSKEIWGDPENFRPERFLDDKGNIINTEKLFAFGYGKRACIGESVARASLFIFFTTLIQRYKLLKSKIHPEPTLKRTAGFTSNPNPYFAQFTLRNK